MRFTYLASAFVVWAGGVGSAAAQSEDAFLRCRAILDVSQRATCYDALVDRQKTGPGEIKGDTSVNGLPSDAISRNDTIQNGGDDTASQASFPARSARLAARRLEKSEATQRRKEALASDQEFSAILRSIQRLPSGKLVAELSNGEVWVQTSTARPPFDHNGAKSVVIRRNVLGTFLMKIDNAPYAFPARRIR